MRPSDPSPPCTNPSGPSEYHTKLSVPANNGKSNDRSCVSGTVHAAIRQLMSCEISFPALPSLLSIQTRPPLPCSNLNINDGRFPTPTRYPISRDITAPGTYGNTSGVPGSAPTRPLMSIHTTPPVHCSDFNNVDTSFSNAIWRSHV